MGVGGQRHALATLPLGKTWYPLYRRLVGPQGRSGWVRKISPPPGFDPRTVQLIVSRYTDCAILAHYFCYVVTFYDTRVGTLIVATIYLQLIQNRYMFRSFTILQCRHQHCVRPFASDVKVVGYL